MIKLKKAQSCRYDILSLGEVMLRMDPGANRIHTTRQFQVWEGGGEYNVARGLRRCFGKRAALVTAIVDNPIGRLLEDLILQGGVDMSWVQWKDFDGCGRESRNGLNFTERGYGLRAAKGCSDRGHTAVSQLKPGDIDWESIFGRAGVRWFHTGGIFAALSETTPELALEAVQCAKQHGTIVSYDLNYRPSLWKTIGGEAKAQEVNQAIAPYIDVMFGNEEDFTSCLGLKVEGQDDSISKIDVEAYKAMIEQAVKQYPNFKLLATSLRVARTASQNDWSAIIYHDGQFFESQKRSDLDIYDRVGGGDSLASGMIYAMLEGKSSQEIVEYGAAHGALAMTTPGDTSTASLAEVEKLIYSKSARVDR